MSEPVTQPVSPYSGSPLGDPRAEKIGQFTALLSQQPPTFQAAISSLRKSLKYNQPGYVMMPYSVELTMADGTRIRSQIMAEATGMSPHNDNGRIVLAKWDGSRFTWCIVDIVGDNMSLTVRRNPTEVRNEWRQPNPTIIPPDAGGTNA